MVEPPFRSVSFETLSIVHALYGFQWKSTTSARCPLCWKRTAGGGLLPAPSCVPGGRAPSLEVSQISMRPSWPPLVKKPAASGFHCTRRMGWSWYSYAPTQPLPSERRSHTFATPSAPPVTIRFASWGDQSTACTSSVCALGALSAMLSPPARSSHSASMPSSPTDASSRESSAQKHTSSMLAVWPRKSMRASKRGPGGSPPALAGARAWGSTAVAHSVLVWSETSHSATSASAPPDAALWSAAAVASAKGAAAV
mmetsp:Transcript_13604/g.56897  ORF Transcript_13604/g.56897 Transcript_13604/m.56897 type:complete len:255 (-) Transcript_13604:584-1348(-)